MRRELSTPRLLVVRCRRCRHRCAVHPSAPTLTKDYHQQYAQDGFLDSLGETRRRQALRIVDAIRRHHPNVDRILDVGAGRCFFLEVARSAGFRHLAAADTSPLAVQTARDKGFEAFLLDAGEGIAAIANGRLPRFQPQVLTLLDVVEHFPADRLLETLAGLMGRLAASLELVVVKVPTSNGLFYRLASALSRLGLHALIEQLYQVDTVPPHHSYFSAASGRRLIGRAGLRLLESFGDRDFEPRSLADRVHLLGRLPAPLGRALGFAADVALRLVPLLDAGVFIAETSRRHQASTPKASDDR